MKCPKCVSENIQVVNQHIVKDTRTTKEFGSCKSCIGTIIFGIPGFLCGLCDMGKTKGKFKDKRKYSNQIIYCCLDCGKQFK